MGLLAVRMQISRFPQVNSPESLGSLGNVELHDIQGRDGQEDVWDLSETKEEECPWSRSHEVMRTILRAPESKSGDETEDKGDYG